MFTSESDRPFEFVSLGSARLQRLDRKGFARLIGAGETERIEEKTLDDFLMRHIETSDPYDTRAQEIRPRYERLKHVLQRELPDVRVYRVGTVEVACYIVGTHKSGTILGLRTVAIET